jgi:hypothetical protein
MIINRHKITNLASTIAVVILLCSSCQTNLPDHGKSISFYHWKSKAQFSEKIENVLTETKSTKIYMHYFDVEQINNPTYYDNGVYPNYVIKQVDSSFIDFDIVPVVYITNQVFKSENLDVLDLSTSIKDLIHQISLKHFNREINTIQIDCDWSQSTKHAYFYFLETLKKDFEIDVTIRLHQVKYKENTGVPPVSHGTLMLYNMGDFKKENENSILESKIVEQYIHPSTNYPLDLHLGLPIFSQTILANTDNEYKIIKGVNRNLYETDQHFEQLENNLFKVVSDTLYKGFHLTQGFTLKLEEISSNQVMASYNHINKSELNIDEIIFYHLDDYALNALNVLSLIKDL